MCQLPLYIIRSLVFTDLLQVEPTFYIISIHKSVNKEGEKKMPLPHIYTSLP